VDGLALPEDLTVVRLIDAGDAFGEDRLAGAVVSRKGGDLARGKVEVDCVQGLHGAEVLLEASHLEQGLGRGGGVFGHLRHLVNCALMKTMPPRTVRGGID
jgi:hypothetical protein